MSVDHRSPDIGMAEKSSAPDRGLWITDGTALPNGLSKRLEFLSSQDSLLIGPKIVEAEKVLNGLIRSLREGE